MWVFPCLKYLKSTSDHRLRPFRRQSGSFHYSFGISGGLAMLPGLFFRAAAALSLPRGRGCTYVSTHLKPKGSFTSRSARSAQGVVGWSSMTRLQNCLRLTRGDDCLLAILNVGSPERAAKR